MNEIEVTKQHMDALKGLADTNLKISEARNALVQLQEQETEYLVSRERKAVARIQRVLEESRTLLEETNRNYEIIEDFGRSVREGTQFLTEANESFQKLLEAKDQHYQDWETDIKNQEETIVSLRNGLKLELSTVQSEKSQVEVAKMNLVKEKRKLDDERGTLARAIQRLKNNKI